MNDEKKIAGIYIRVSTDDQRDNGYSIDSQLRMIKEYCEKNEYDIVDVYNDVGHFGKDLMRPEMQRLLKDIKSKKIDKLVAIKVDRLTRNNYDGFWLLNYDVKIEQNKELNPLEWTKLMNNYKNTVEEIILINNLQKRGKNYQNNLILFLYFS